MMDALRAFETADGGNRLTWFNLGDRDLATHLFRTGRLAGGATLSQVTADVARRFGVQARLLPMTDSRVETRVTIALGDEVPNFGGLATPLAEDQPPGQPVDRHSADRHSADRHSADRHSADRHSADRQPRDQPQRGPQPGDRPPVDQPMSNQPVKAAEHAQDGPGWVEVGFQEYFVGFRHSVSVKQIRFAGADLARPAPGVLDAIAAADVVVICPSNPIVSIGPVMAVPGIAEAVMERRNDVVAVSPIIAGKALKGPADRMLSELGHEASATGVARLWAPLAATLVVDEQDAGLAAEVEAEGMRCVVAPSVMSGPREAANLARAVLGTSARC